MVTVGYGYGIPAAADRMGGSDAQRETAPVFQIHTLTLTSSPNDEISPFASLCHQKLVAMGMFILSSLPDTMFYHDSTYDDELAYDDDDEWEEFIVRKYGNGTDYRFADESELVDEQPIANGAQY